MEHSFNILIASLYGIEEAIFIQNMVFWINKNSANNTNFHNGFYWTHNSAKSLSKQFGYIKPSKINRVVKKLENEGLIQIGNFNDSTYNRTQWYAFTELGVSILKNAGFILQNPFFILQNGSEQNAKSILQNEKCILYTDNKTTYTITDNKDKKKEFQNLSSSELPNNLAPQPPSPPAPRKFDFKRALLEIGVSEQSANDWLIARKTKRASNTKSAFELNYKEIQQAVSNGYTADECINMAAAKSWQGFKFEWFKNEKLNEQKSDADNKRGKAISNAVEYDQHETF